MKSTKPEWHNEDQIEAAARDWLHRDGWRVTPRSAFTGPDIRAVDPKGRPWVFEVKGFPPTFQKRDGSAKTRNTIRAQRRVWFIEALEARFS